MYKRIKLIIVTTFLILAIFAIMVTSVAGATTYEYQIQVTQSGQPVADAEVRLSGVGVELTGLDGIATFDMGDAPGRGQGRQGLYRGQRYATKKGKASGTVVDEYDIVAVEITGSTFSYGSTIKIRLNELYAVDI